MAYEDLYNSDNSTTDDLVNNPWVNNFATRGMLSGVQFLAETLGKPARALFGTLAGKPEELLNLIPFSDTLGITDPNQAVGGRDLMREYGLVGPEDNWGNFLGGLALDVAADPLGFVKGPLGALTKLGETAAKSGKGLGRSVAKRIAANQGGLFQIMDRPWYAEMIGMGKQSPVYTAGIDPFLKPQMEAVAKGLESGWSKATRATVPGTQFSPLAWMRSAFEPGAANVTGHPVLVDTFGDVNQATYKGLAGDHADAVGKANLLGRQSDVLNALKNTGLDDAKANYLAQQAFYSIKELGELDFIPSWATREQIDIASDYARQASVATEGLTDAPRNAALEVGHEVGDVEQRYWKFPYVPRAQAGSGNKLTTHSAPRNPHIEKLPGGSSMGNAMLSDPIWYGGDPAESMAAGIEKWAPIIKRKAEDRAFKIYSANAEKVPDAIKELLKDKGAAELAAEIGRIAAAREMPDDFIKGISRIKGLNKEIAAKGGELIPLEPMSSFYRPDIAMEYLDYGKSMAKLTAPRASAIETLAREVDRYRDTISVNPTAKGMHSLTDALKEIKIPNAKAKLAQRLGVAEGELAQLGVKDDVVKALYAEVNPTPPTAKSEWTKYVDALRYGFTIPWPANLVRNWTSTGIDMGLANTGATRNLNKANDFLRGNMTPERYTLEEIKHVQSVFQGSVEHGVSKTDQIHAQLGTGFDKAGNAIINTKPAQPGKSWIQSLKDWARPLVSEQAGRDIGVQPLREIAAESAMNPATKKAAEYLGIVVDPVRRQMGIMEQAHHFQNEVTRLQQMLNLADQGYNPRAAAERVKINQRDFLEGSTPFVQNQLRNFIPFANFAHQNIRSQADMLSRQPGRYSTLMNILNSGRDSGGFVPGYASSGASIELPGAEPGQKRFLSSLGLTQEDEMMSGIANLLALRPEEGVRKIVSGMNPALKIPFEMATGTQVFSGRRLDDLKPSTAATVATLGMNPDAARFLSELASGTPMARVFSTVDRLADYERRGIGNLALNLLTGTRTVDVDQEMASQIAARDAITKLLNASDQYKLREQLVVEPKWKGREEEMPEAIRQMWVQYQLLQQAAKKAVQERQAAGQR